MRADFDIRVMRDKQIPLWPYSLLADRSIVPPKTESCREILETLDANLIANLIRDD
jgi:hypothetical protein